MLAEWLAGAEHLLVSCVAERTALARRLAWLRAVAFQTVAPNNPYRQRHGATFVDPDGYRVVIAVPPDTR